MNGLPASIPPLNANVNECRDCHGTGRWRHKAECSTCNGKGYFITYRNTPATPKIVRPPLGRRPTEYERPV